MELSLDNLAKEIRDRHISYSVIEDNFKNFYLDKILKVLDLDLNDLEKRDLVREARMTDLDKEQYYDASIEFDVDDIGERYGFMHSEEAEDYVRERVLSYHDELESRDMAWLEKMLDEHIPVKADTSKTEMPAWRKLYEAIDGVPSWLCNGDPTTDETLFDTLEDLWRILSNWGGKDLFSVSHEDLDKLIPKLDPDSEEDAKLIALLYQLDQIKRFGLKNYKPYFQIVKR